MSDIIKKYIKMLRQPIYTGERLKRHLDMSGFVGIIIACICLITTVLNIVQEKYVVAFTTAFICVSGFIIFVTAKLFHSLTGSNVTALIMCIFNFTFYAIDGSNDGFAVIWTLLVPLAFCYFGGVIHGIALSIYFEILFIVLFYTPIRENMAASYSEVFMDRFPILYLCGLLINSVAMINYHVNTLNQQEYEKELKDTVKRAVSAEKAKSRFLAQMSHEIRTPINAVLGMNEMILHETENEDILEYSENIRTAGKTLLTLINSILDFSKIEDGKMEIIPVTYDTASMINNVVNSVSERAKQKELSFVTDIDPAIPSKLEGDDVRVGQVIMNLLTNAVKYTEKGTVTLTIKKVSEEGNDVILDVSVKDTGIGIKREDMERLFESFERLDEVRNHNIEGTGLGMSIVTGLLGMMGSKLKVESTYGKGSEFSFTFRQKIIDPAPMGDYSERHRLSTEVRADDIGFSAPEASILVVDDNEMNLKVAKNLLKLYDIVPELAPSGSRAIELMRAKRYDIVMLDHMMPEMDGIETLAKIKEEGLLRDDTIVIALTANAVAGAREAYLEAGFEDYLSKPIELPRLEDKLKAYLPPEYLHEREKVGKNGKPTESNDNSDLEVIEFLPGGETVIPTEKTTKTRLSAGAMYKLAERGIDVQMGLGYCAKDKTLYYELLRDYTAASAEKSEKLRSFVENGDLEGYAVLVHALKSTSKTIGAVAVFEKARELEFAAKAGEKETVESGHTVLSKIYDKTVADISDALGT